MQEIQRFRTSLGGFHRGDVANYIERSAAAHAEELRRLRDEIAALQAEKQAAQAQVRELTAQLEAAAEGKAPEQIPEDPAAQELAAYRRAEAAERAARQRIRRQTEKFNDLAETIGGEYAETGAQLQTASAEIEAGIARVQALLTEARDSFRIRQEELAALKTEFTDEEQ